MHVLITLAKSGRDYEDVVATRRIGANSVLSPICINVTILNDQEGGEDRMEFFILLNPLDSRILVENNSTTVTIIDNDGLYCSCVISIIMPCSLITMNSCAVHLPCLPMSVCLSV